VLDRAGAVGIEHGDDLADPPEQVVGHHELGAAGAENRGDADAALAGKLGDRRQSGKPDAAAEHDDVLAGGIDGEADPERPDHVERIAHVQRRQSIGAAADALVEKLEATVLRVDAINALRPPQPKLASVRRRA